AMVRDLITDPRYRVKTADGRQGLARGGERYDIIVTDAIPRTETNSGVFQSREFFEVARLHLRSHGLFVLWLPSPRLLATLRSIFPYGVVFDGNIGVASNDPIAFDRGALMARLHGGTITRHLTEGAVNLDLLEKTLRDARFESFGPDSPRPEG